MNEAGKVYLRKNYHACLESNPPPIPSPRHLATPPIEQIDHNLAKRHQCPSPICTMSSTITKEEIEERMKKPLIQVNARIAPALETPHAAQTTGV